MKRPDVIQGSYECGPLKVVYRTYCQHCAHLAECKKRRAPREGCKTVGDVEFLINDKGVVGWSGVITQKKIDRIVRDYLEKEPPEDVSMPAVQMGV